MIFLPFHRVKSESLQIVIWVSRLFYMAGVLSMLLGVFKEFYSVYKWIASPIYSEDRTRWTSYQYSLDLLHPNWHFIFLGIILVFSSCILITLVVKSELNLNK
ncbi:hypothetical protein CTT31_18485 [Pseudoalteromonas maricaloris]|nr:hypothetical protein CTT31_18485 [Pseudoalteromonas flavipulchra]